MKRRVVSLILAVVMVLTAVPMVSFAEDERPLTWEDIYYPETTNPAEDEADDETPEIGGENYYPEITEPTTGDVATPSDVTEPEDGNVATVYLCSIYYNIPHIFIYIVNNTGHSLKVGAYNLPAGEGVSLGTLGFSTFDGDGLGLFYNMETYRYGSENLFKNFICLSKDINTKQLSRISSFIVNSNFWDPVFFNCIYFALMVWDLAGGSFIFPIQVIPYITRLSMIARGAKYRNINFTIPGRNNVYKQRIFGDNARLEVVKDRSLS